MTAELVDFYGFPSSLIKYVENQTLVLVNKFADTRTLEFDIPRLGYYDYRGEPIRWYNLSWIHPEFNAKFCEVYDKVPGDLPNYWITKDNDMQSESANFSDKLETVDDLEAFLMELSSRS